MNYITTTELRTKTTWLVAILKKGESVFLIHRSKIIGEIRPIRKQKPFTKYDTEKLQKKDKSSKYLLKSDH